MEVSFEEMAQSIIDMDKDKAEQLAEKVIEKEINPQDAIEEGFSQGIKVVGDKFDKMEIYLPELMQASEAMLAAVDILQPHLGAEGRKKEGKVLMATVEGDVHYIGKNIVKTMLESAGFDVIDLGHDVPADSIVDKAEETEPDIIALSAIMSTTMLHMPDVLDLLSERGLRDKFKVLVGGAPLTKDWVEEIGADGYAENAGGAVNSAKELLE